MSRFQQECGFLESIRHPNIVQYLGMTRDPESRLPVLLMELLDESLTKMLERSQQSLAYCVQVDICHDIALAVTYLHSNDIIHRDLSSNNVLMIAGKRAKVTDFGMSKLAGAAPSMTPLTMCPGTLAYMPPEALREPPRYTKKLDCFSEGVIMIQVCTRLWPEPGPRTQVVEDSRSPMGVIEMPVSEIERRNNHIDLIDPNHALLLIAKDCLRFQEKDRPSSEELCQRLADLKESTEYRESTHEIQDEVQPNNDQGFLPTQQLQEKDRRIHKMEDAISSKDQQLQDTHRTLQWKDNEIQELNSLLQQKERQLQEERASRDRRLQEEIIPRERQLQQLNQQLKEQEQISSELQQIYHFLQRQVEQLQQQLSQQRLRPPQPPPPYQARRQLQERESRKQLPVQPSLQVDHKPHPHRARKMTSTWREGSKAPFKMSRGAAVVHGNIAYFMSWNGEVCSYNLTSKMWSKLPKCTYYRGGIAVVNDQLITIGGCKATSKKNTYTNKLIGVSGNKEIFPPMPTKRASTTVLTSKEYLIVAGGTIGLLGADRLNTVEVMNSRNLVWSTVANLPHPYLSASGTHVISGDQLYMLGGFDDNGMTKSVLTCSLTELLQSSSSSSSIWHRVADASAYHSTCAAVSGELLAVGGCDEDRKPSSDIHKYNPITNSWDLISNLPTSRYFSLVAVLPWPTYEMMVVGGSNNIMYSDTEKVEIATSSFDTFI